MESFNTFMVLTFSIYAQYMVTAPSQAPVWGRVSPDKMLQKSGESGIFVIFTPAGEAGYGL